MLFCFVGLDDFPYQDYSRRGGHATALMKGAGSTPANQN